jgi:precorrin-2 dehydrogenase/sirohydrochlorin ferrochelatase
MPFGYPVMLELAGRRCVVIGELAVQEGKVEGLVAAGADDVVIVTPGPEDRLGGLALVDGVAVRRRRWRPDDLGRTPATCRAMRATSGSRIMSAT